MTPPERNYTVVMICVIGDSYSSNFLKCWTEFLGYCLTHNIRPMLSNITSTSFFIEKNSCLLCSADGGEKQVPFKGNLEYDYILWLSSKSVFPANLLEQLIRHNAPVVAPLCVNSQNIQQMNFIEQLDFETAQEYAYVSRTQVESYQNDNVENLKVDYVDMNQCMLVKKGVLETIQYPWFGGGLNGLTGEAFFFKKCKEHGIQLVVDLKTQVRSETSIVL